MEPVTGLLLLGMGVIALTGGLGSRKGAKAGAAADTSDREDTAPAGTVPAPDPIFEDFALDVLGKPYEWGAEGPDAFDCSGLVAYASELGILPRGLGRQTADGYYRMLLKVTGKIRAGDVLFYGIKGGPATHAAIAASDEDDDGRLLVLSASGSKAKGGSVRAYDRATYRADFLGAGRP